MIKAEIVADSLSPQGDRLISVLVTFPRIILAEVNTHRMLSKNTSSSRAIPFKKMVEAIQENPFIPIAWQKEHKGMQGNEYITDKKNLGRIVEDWLEARDSAVYSAQQLNKGFNKKDGTGKYVLTKDELKEDSVTKQLCNRLLEPFMWTTMLITGSKEGWDNFFELRCPSYDVPVLELATKDGSSFNSKKDAIKMFPQCAHFSEMDWRKCNKGQAEIHIMDLAEKIYDAMNESTPKQLKAGQWHIPLEDKIADFDKFLDEQGWSTLKENIPFKVKVATSMAARTSYTVVGDEKEIDYKRMIELHDRLIAQNPPHSSPMEHCARAMNDKEYFLDDRGIGMSDKNVGWCRNFKGFIPYRHIIESKI